MKKKIVSLTMAAAMTLSCAPAILAGCGGDSVDREHTIVFYSSQGNTLTPVTEHAIASFEAKYPNWKIDHQTPGGYDQVKEKIMQDFEGDNQPDLAYCYPDHVAQYMPTELVYDMNSFIKSTDTIKSIVPDAVGVADDAILGFKNDEIADFTETFWNEGLAKNYTGYADYDFTEDSMLSLPFVKSTELLYYNKTVLDELNLTPPETWDELWEQAEKIKAVDKYKKATVLGYDSEANWFINMCEQNGWGYTSVDANNHYLFNSNNDDLKTWLGSLKDMYSKSKGWITTQELYGSYTSGLFTAGPADGGLVYCIGSSGGAAHQDPGKKFTAAIAPIPGSKRDDGTINKSVISQGPSLVMLKAGGVSNVDEKAKMTFLFIKELLDPTFQQEFSKASGYNPCRESVYNDAGYKSWIEEGDLIAQAVGAASEARENFFTSPAFVGSSTARDQVGSAMVYVMKGQRTPEVALNTAYKNCGGK